MTTTSKIRIKMGEIEIEYEGSEAFLTKELHELLEGVSKIYQSGERKAAEPPARNTNSETPGGGGAGTGSIQGTTSTLAAKLGIKAGHARGLLTAAAAHLTFVANSPTFSRQQLLDAAKTATSYYKSSVSSNLSATLISLVQKNEFVEHSKDIFALSAEKKKQLETTLAV